MSVFYCKKCYGTILEWGGAELFEVFDFICDLHSNTKNGFVDISWVYNQEEIYARLQMLEDKGALITHETDKGIIMRPNHVHFFEELKCKEGCCSGFVFCVEGGHVSVAKE